MSIYKTVRPIDPRTTVFMIPLPTPLWFLKNLRILSNIDFNIAESIFMLVYMLEEKDQLILLELLFHGRLKIHDLLNLIPFNNDKECFKHVRRLERWKLIHGSTFWGLTFHGKVRAKLISLDRNNPKNYSVNLRSEIIEFAFEP